MIKAFLFCVSACLLAGCTLLTPVTLPPMQTYTINLPGKITENPPPVLEQSIMVMPVLANRGFDTKAMLYQQTPYTLAAFAQNAWIAPPASMLTALITQSLQASHLFKAVLNSPSLASSRYTLTTTLTSLYQDFTVSPSEVVLDLNASLINNQSNQTIAEKSFHLRLQTNRDTPYAGVTAINQAASTLVTELTHFVIVNVSGS